MVRDMPKGNPQPGDEGLDRTHTWGRTYWGGAQFCLLADVTIREQTHNRKGLQDALRAIVAAGGTIDQDWPIRKAFAGGRRRHRHACARRSLRPHERRAGPGGPRRYLEEAGNSRNAGGVRVDDKAPEATIRIAITATPPSGRITSRQC